MENGAKVEKNAGANSKLLPNPWERGKSGRKSRARPGLATLSDREGEMQIGGIGKIKNLFKSEKFLGKCKRAIFEKKTQNKTLNKTQNKTTPNKKTKWFVWNTKLTHAPKNSSHAALESRASKRLSFFKERRGSGRRRVGLELAGDTRPPIG